MRINPYLTILALCVALQACSEHDSLPPSTDSATTARPAASIQPDTAMNHPSYPASQAPNVGKNAPPDNLQIFATNGATILDSQTGDLNSDGRPDILLVLDSPHIGHEKLGEGDPRAVLILVRDESGKLHQVAQNTKLVPCGSCGGIAGDPYGYTNIEPGQFTIALGGGSREHWSDEFTFKYSNAKNDWLLEKVSRRVVDRETEATKELELMPKDFGTVSFKDFDPSNLPDISLP